MRRGKRRQVVAQRRKPRRPGSERRVSKLARSMRACWSGGSSYGTADLDAAFLILGGRERFCGRNDRFATQRDHVPKARNQLEDQARGRLDPEPRACPELKGQDAIAGPRADGSEGSAPDDRSGRPHPGRLRIEREWDVILEPDEGRGGKRLDLQGGAAALSPEHDLDARTVGQAYISDPAAGKAAVEFAGGSAN